MIPIETVRTETFTMDYFRFGRGSRTLVILPGLSIQSVMPAADAVAAAYQSLQDEFTIYLFDRRADLPPVYTVHDMARFIILAEGTRGFNVVPELDRIRCPVLALGVYEDRVLDSDATMEIAEKLDERPDFRLYMYIGYGHAAFDTAPDYRQRILRFLNS